MRIILSILLLSVCYPVTIDGYAYLENQTDHSGIKVLFERIVPSIIKDSTYTDNYGYYDLELQVGVYTITFSKENYMTKYIDYTVNDDLTISDIFLIYRPHFIQSKIDSSSNCSIPF